MRITVSLQYVGKAMPASRQRPVGSRLACTARMPRLVWFRNIMTPRSVAPICSNAWIAIGRCETCAS
jgi:hypothetical protein